MSFVHLGPNSREDVTCKLTICLNLYEILQSLEKLWNDLCTDSSMYIGNYINPYLWSCVEPSIALVSTCIPSVSYLFKRAISLFFPTADAGNVAYVNEQECRPRLVGRPAISGESLFSSHIHTFIELKGEDITTIATQLKVTDGLARRDWNV